MDPAEAADCLADAAARGGPEANALVARLSGWGVMRSRDITRALDNLQRAAELGWLPSRLELQCLARDSGSDWGTLRRKVDVANWTRAGAARVLSDSPRICAIEGFATAAECDWLIGRGGHGMRRAQVYRRDAPGHAEAESRTNTESDFTFWNADLVLRLIRDRIAACIGRGHAILRSDEIAALRAGSAIQPARRLPGTDDSRARSRTRTAWAARPDISRLPEPGL